MLGKIHWQVGLGAEAPGDARRERVFELNSDDEGDAPEVAEKAQQSPKSIESLADDDAPLDRHRNVRCLRRLS